MSALSQAFGNVGNKVVPKVRERVTSKLKVVPERMQMLTNQATLVVEMVTDISEGRYHGLAWHSFGIAGVALLYFVSPTEPGARCDPGDRRHGRHAGDRTGHAALTQGPAGLLQAQALRPQQVLLDDPQRSNNTGKARYAGPPTSAPNTLTTRLAPSARSSRSKPVSAATASSRIPRETRARVVLDRAIDTLPEDFRPVFVLRARRATQLRRGR